MDKFIKIVLLAALIKASSLCAAVGEDQTGLPKLFTVTVSQGGGLNETTDAMKAMTDSMEPLEAFQAIKHYAAFASVPGGNDLPAHNKMLGALYLHLFIREGGWSKIQSLGSLAELCDPKEAPLIVKTFHNGLTRLYKDNKQDRRVNDMLKFLVETLRYQPSAVAFSEYNGNIDQ